MPDIYRCPVSGCRYPNDAPEAIAGHLVQSHGIQSLSELSDGARRDLPEGALDALRQLV